jgi:hypothetical protein
MQFLLAEIVVSPTLRRMTRTRSRPRPDHAEIAKSIIMAILHQEERHCMEIRAFGYYEYWSASSCQSSNTSFQPYTDCNLHTCAGGIYNGRRERPYREY